MPPWARTWIEHWPAGVAQLSFAQRSVPLAPAEVQALLLRNAGAPAPQTVLEALAHRLDRELAALPPPAFVRLGSRSAKDTPLAVLTGSRADDGAAAVRLLTAGSHRVTLDLRRACAHGLAPCIHLRQWREIPWWSEFRCFLREGQLAGASQYHTRQPLPEDILQQLDAIRGAIDALAARIARAWGDAPVVADVAVTPEGEATLIELNPWGPATDAALFSWKAEDFDGSLRVRREAACAPWL